MSDHFCTIRALGLFQEDSFKRYPCDDFSLVVGKVKDSERMALRGFEYPEKEWPESKARKHCEDAGGEFVSAKLNDACVKAAGDIEIWVRRKFKEGDFNAGSIVHRRR